MSRQVIVFRHMDGDTPGRFSDLFAAAGYAVETVDLHRGQAIPALDRYDLMLVLGGAMHSWQEDAHPWLAAEKQAIREWVGERARPYIGICLGHQLLADALGGEVGLASTPEVGICEVAVDQAGDHPFSTGIAGRHMLPQWHLAEVTRLPAGAQSLAASAGTAVQAMAVDSHALGCSSIANGRSRRSAAGPESTAGCRPSRRSSGRAATTGCWRPPRRTCRASPP
jgi:GMP synthase-like glutamine amidotransferase